MRKAIILAGLFPFALLGLSARAESLEDFVVQSGHADGYRGCDLSADGRYALSHGYLSNRAILWDTRTRCMIRVFEPPSSKARINAARISRDGRLALTGHSDKHAYLWDTATGSIVRRFECGGIVDSVQFANVGSLAIAECDDNRARVWSLESGELLHVFADEGGSVSTNYLWQSADSRRAVTKTNSGGFILWDLVSFSKIRELTEGNKRPTNSYVARPREKVVFSGDRVFIYDNHVARAFSASDGAPVVRDPETLRAPPEPPGESEDATPPGLEYVKRGRVSANYNVSVKNGVVGFVKKGKYLAFDLKTARLLHAFPTSDYRSVSLSPDGRYVMIELKSTGEEILASIDGNRKMPLPSGSSFMLLDGICHIAVLPPPIPAPGAPAPAAMEIYEIEAWGLRLVKRALLKDIAPGAAVSRHFQSGVVYLKDADGIKVVDARDWSIKGSFPGSLAIVAPSSDGSRFLARETGSGPEAASLHVACALDGSSKKLDLAYDERITYSLSADGECLVAFDPKGRSTAYDLATGARQELSFGAPTADFMSGVATVFFRTSPASGIVVSGSLEKSMFGVQRSFYYSNLRTGCRNREIIGHGLPISDLQFVDSRQFVSSSKDGTLKVWNAADCSLAATIAVSDDGEWLIWTPDGYWDGSARCGELVAMVRGLDDWRIDQFAVRSNRPDIVLSRLGRSDTELVAHYRALHERRLARLGLVDADGRPDESRLPSGLEAPESRILTCRQAGGWLHLEAELSAGPAAGSALEAWQVYVNDVPLFAGRGRPVSGSSARVDASIELTPGDNKIEVCCSSSAGFESLRAATAIRHESPSKGSLIYVGFGVSRYADSPRGGQMDLAYAAKDAIDLGAALTAEPGLEYDGTRCHLFVDEKATSANVRTADELLADARPEDTLVIFVSGHGFFDATDEYRFLTYDADPHDLERTTISYEELENLLRRVPPRRKLMLMDTCASGERAAALPDIPPAAPPSSAAPEVSTTESGATSPRPRVIGPAGVADGPEPYSTRRGVLPEWLFERDRYIHNDLLRRSGAVVFSSCAGDQLSWESDDFANGVFTEYLLRALSGDADTNGDRRVGLAELRAFVCSGVLAETSSGLYPREQSPTVDRDNIYMDFGFSAPH